MPIWHKNHELARIIVHFIGIAITATALLAICGFLAKRPVLYNWGVIGVMSLPTAACLLGSGIAFYLVSRGESSGDEG